ncbi:DUF4190 domain-containing protein [Candidatus Saccharibacteria bacterium]|nr:DUF4190 domain-containing protein [Candidatus Saccharibacteria bacterium]
MDNENQNNSFSPGGGQALDPTNQPFGQQSQQTSGPRIIMPPTSGQGINELRPDDYQKPRPVTNAEQVDSSSNQNNTSTQSINPTPQPIDTTTVPPNNFTTPPAEKPISYSNDATAMAKNALIMVIISLVMLIPQVGNWIGGVLLKINLGAMLSLIITIIVKLGLPVVSLILVIVALRKMKQTGGRGLTLAITTLVIDVVVIALLFFIQVLPLIRIAFHINQMAQQTQSEMSNDTIKRNMLDLSASVSTYISRNNKLPTSASDIQPYRSFVDNVGTIEIRAAVADGSVNVEFGRYVIVTNARCASADMPNYTYRNSQSVGTSAWAIFSLLNGSNGEKIIYCLG